MIKNIALIFVFVVATSSWFYEKRSGILSRLNAYNVQFSLTNSLLKEFSSDCNGFEFGKYYAFQDHALSRYRAIVEGGMGFPFYIDSSYLEVEEIFRQNWELFTKQAESCDLQENK